MLQLHLVREKPEYVRERLLHRHFPEPDLVDTLLSVDADRRAAQAETESLQAQVNAISKEIGKLMGQGKKAEAEDRKKEVEALQARMSPLRQKLQELEQSLNDLLLRLPNLPAAEVPSGKSAEDNLVVREGGHRPNLPESALPHWELLKKFDLADFELGNKVTGSGFPFFCGEGARLQRALIQYFLDFNRAAGYREYLPPLVVQEASAYGTGQLPDKDGQMYHVPEDGLYLIPTAEVPLTNIYRNSLLQASELPVKLTAYTPCFRREAGSYGRDVKGLNRLHQFDKVEIVQIVPETDSYRVLEEMVAHVEALVQSLELPYRILRLCGGDMGFASALTYDFEVYSAAQERWLEVSSVSNFETFQSNRLKLRYKAADGQNRLAHTLNGSSLALPRIYAALLENHQAQDHIRIPSSLSKYFGERIDLPTSPASRSRP